MAEFGLTPDLYRELRRAGRYCISRVFGALVKEPFNVQPSQLGLLTPVMVKHLYLRKDDEADGSEHAPFGNLPPAMAHRRQCELRGMSEADIVRTWHERLAADPSLAALHAPPPNATG